MAVGAQAVKSGKVSGGLDEAENLNGPTVYYCSSAKEVMEIKGAAPRVRRNSWILQRKIQTERKQLIAQNPKMTRICDTLGQKSCGYLESPQATV
jgi:hypothetical protein